MGVSIFSFILVIVVIVAVHELGHYLVGRWCGIRATAFAVGFGPEIAGRTDSQGCRWKLCWIPLGGYVRFVGDAADSSQPPKPGSLAAAALWKRAATVAAGPIANFLLTFAIFAIAFMVAGQNLPGTRIQTVAPDGPAAAAGLQPGDDVVLIDGAAATGLELRVAVRTSPGEPVALTVDRAGELVELEVVPQPDAEGDGHIGVAIASERGRLGPVAAVSASITVSWLIVKVSLKYLYGIVTGEKSADAFSGPVGIAKHSGDAATEGGAKGLLGIIALLSIGIGLVNLLPIPMLDGGHLLLYAYEAVRGKPPHPAFQMAWTGLGAALLLFLFVYITWNDITKLAG